MLTSVTAADGIPAGPITHIIRRERKWFDMPDDDVVDRPQPRISASRWVGNASDRCEQQSEIETDCHVVGIALQPMAEVTVFAGRKLIQSGHLPRGSMRVNEPGLPMRGIFRGAYDVLHLHVPNALIAEYANAECSPRRATPLITDHPVVDPVIERLACIWPELRRRHQSRHHRPIVRWKFRCRVLPASRVSALSKWRLKRATEYMAANLAEPISLADIAAAAGLSRMHFAAQFRAATGLRPHEYLLQLRIERAQDLLSTSRLPLVEIAFEVGFKTQAHFTTVFARFVGETPNVWRQLNSMTSDVRFLKAA
jgi:AraC family transcriptional regulator